MAISTYTELQTAIGNWLNRSDTDVTARIPEFISLCEAQIKRRLRRKTVRAALSLTDADVPLPTTLAELRSLRLNTSTAAYNGPIDIVTPEALADHRRTFSSTGRPRFASVVNSELLLVPAPDQTYTSEIIYFEALVALAAGNPTNTTLTEAPDLYLFGSLKEAEPYLEHDERAPMWTQKFNDALAELETVREREEFAASLRPVRLPAVFG